MKANAAFAEYLYRATIIIITAHTVCIDIYFEGINMLFLDKRKIILSSGKFKIPPFVYV